MLPLDTFLGGSLHGSTALSKRSIRTESTLTALSPGSFGGDSESSSLSGADDTMDPGALELLAPAEQDSPPEVPLRPELQEILSTQIQR